MQYATIPNQVKSCEITTAVRFPFPTQILANRRAAARCDECAAGLPWAPTLDRVKACQCGGRWGPCCCIVGWGGKRRGPVSKRGARQPYVSSPEVLAALANDDDRW